jgi:pimeloyl-ACP methyl ester carboxylesterase
VSERSELERSDRRRPGDEAGGTSTHTGRMPDPPTPARAPLSSSPPPVDGLAVYRRGIEGAPRVVLVHGVMDRAGGFVKLLRRLGGLDVIRYDRRGYGASRGGPLNRTIAAHVDDLLAVVGDEPAVVVGHSLGGLVALAAAARRPDLIPSVAAFEAPMPWRESPSAASTRRLVALSEGGEEAAGDAAEQFLQRMLGERTWARLPAVMRRDRRAEGPALVAEMLAARNEGEIVDPAAITVPVLAGYGGATSERHRVAAVALAEEARHGELWVIDGAAHPAHYTHADQFAAFVERAVARRP